MAKKITAQQVRDNLRQHRAESAAFDRRMAKAAREYTAKPRSDHLLQEDDDVQQLVDSQMELLGQPPAERHPGLPSDGRSVSLSDEELADAVLKRVPRRAKW